MKHVFALTVLTTGFAALDSAAFAAPRIVTLDIGGFAPVICKVEVTAPWAASLLGQTALGRLSEACNDPRGFEVRADYSGLVDATLLIDGQGVAPSNSGSTRIDVSDRAVMATKDLALNVTPGRGGPVHNPDGR